MREKRSLIFYCAVKLEWAREEYTICCARNEGSGLAWFGNRGMRKGLEKEDVLCVVIIKMRYMWYLNVRKRESGSNF
jgi:hypothetical protein